MAERLIEMNIVPSNEHINSWIQQYVPELDFFFIKESDLLELDKFLFEVLIIPKNEFFKHNSYNDIQMVNSYEFWSIANDVQYIIVAKSEWFNKLPKDQKNMLNKRQVEINRGLVLPLNNTNSNISDDHLVIQNNKTYIVIQSKMWNSLSYQLKAEMLLEYAKKWDSWSCSELSEKAPIHLKQFANTFPYKAGSNCLSATLFAATQHEWKIHEWVHPQTFLEGIKKAGYLIHEGDVEDTDIITWINTEGVIQHASYCIGDKLFFNKNGQTFFNPWKIVEWTKLNEEWKKFNTRIYRKPYNNRI